MTTFSYELSLSTLHFLSDTKMYAIVILNHYLKTYILFLVVDCATCGEHVKVGEWCNSRTCWENDACGNDG